MSDEAGIFEKKKFGGPNLGQMCQNRVQNRFFVIFSSMVH